MELTGSLGRDWLRDRGAGADRSSGSSKITDELLREWRDYLEEQLKNHLSISADLVIGDRTRFSFIEASSTHTIVEIEAFARKSLDKFLDNRANKEQA